MRREGRTHWGMGRLESTAVTLLLRLVWSKTGRKTLRRKTMSLRISFLKSENKMGTTWNFLCGCLWEMIAVREGYIIVEFAVYGHQMCYCESVVMWGELVWGEERPLWQTHTHTNTQLLFCSSGEGPRVQMHTHRHTRREENWAGWGGQATAPLANMFGSLVNIAFDNTGWRVNSEHL